MFRFWKNMRKKQCNNKNAMNILPSLQAINKGTVEKHSPFIYCSLHFDVICWISDIGIIAILSVGAVVVYGIMVISGDGYGVLNGILLKLQ